MLEVGREAPQRTRCAGAASDRAHRGGCLDHDRHLVLARPVLLGGLCLDPDENEFSRVR